MGTGQIQLTAQPVADHRLGTSQGINAAPLAVGRQGLAIGVIRKAGNHGDGRGTGIAQALPSLQQDVGTRQLAPAGPALPLAQADADRSRSGFHRTQAQPEAGPATVGHLEVPQPQVLLDTGIQQQANALRANRLECQFCSRETIET